METYWFSERIPHPTLDVHALTLRPRGQRLAVESISALQAALAGVPDAHVVLDLRDVSDVASDAIEALAVLDRWLRETCGGTVTVRIVTTRQLLAFERAGEVNLLIG